MAESMIERVARAIRLADIKCASRRHPGIPYNLIECAADGLQADHDAMARAAIEAMREPTEAMTKVAADDILAGPGISAFLNWQDLSASRYRLMIDTALNEQVAG